MDIFFFPEEVRVARPRSIAWSFTAAESLSLFPAPAPAPACFTTVDVDANCAFRGGGVLVFPMPPFLVVVSADLA